MTYLTVLTLNDNYLTGTVPPLARNLLQDYNYTESNRLFTKTFKGAVLLHNNRLSCVIPSALPCPASMGNSCLDNATISPGHLLAVMGNMFDGPLEPWTGSFEKNATM